MNNIVDIDALENSLHLVESKLRAIPSFPLSIEYGGTGVSSLEDLRTSIIGQTSKVRNVLNTVIANDTLDQNIDQSSSVIIGEIDDPTVPHQETIAIGYGAAVLNGYPSFGVYIGHNAGQNSGDGQEFDNENRVNGRGNIAIGWETMCANGSGRINCYNTIAAGFNAMKYEGNTDAISQWNVAIGNLAMTNMADSAYFDHNVAVGPNCMFNQSQTRLRNSVAIGSGVNVSDSNEFRCGNSSVTVKCTKLVQDSDLRDKTDIVDTDYDYRAFIKGLRPVRFRWDNREDYLPKIEDMPSDEFGWHEYPTQTINDVVHDGTYKRTRLHDGFIAQEVKELADSLGFDFAGYQDSEYDGGLQKRSLSYTDFIPPLVKVVQDLMKENEELRARLTALESKMV